MPGNLSLPLPQLGEDKSSPTTSSPFSCSSPTLPQPQSAFESADPEIPAVFRGFDEFSDADDENATCKQIQEDKPSKPCGSADDIGGNSPDTPAVFHGFDEFLDEDVEDTAYKHDQEEKPPTKPHRSTNDTDGKIPEPSTTDVSKSAKRARGDDEPVTKMAKQKTGTTTATIQSEQTRANSNGKKRPVCATKQQITAPEGRVVTGDNSNHTSSRVAPMRQSQGTATIRRVLRSSDAAPSYGFNLASTLDEIFSVGSKPDAGSKSAAGSKPAAGSKLAAGSTPYPDSTLATTPKLALATSTKSSTTRKTTAVPSSSHPKPPSVNEPPSTSTAAPSVTKSSIVEYVGRVPVSSFQQPDAEKEDLPSNSKSKSKAKPKKKVKPKVSQKLAKSVGVKVAKLENRGGEDSDSDDGPRPLSKVAKKLSATQVAARKATKQKGAGSDE